MNPREIAKKMVALEDWQRLGRITTRDENGRHFTALYSPAWLARMEAAGMIAIHRPIHAATGRGYVEEYWSVEVTPAACEAGENCNWGMDEGRAALLDSEAPAA